MNFISGAILILVCLGSAFWYWIAHKEHISGDLSKIRSPLVILDFDGTLCPSYRLFISQFNSISDEYGLKKIQEEEIETFRDLNPKSAMKLLGVSTFKLPFILRRIRLNVQEHLLELEPVKGMKEMLKEWKSKGTSLGILTSNSEKNVRLYLQKYGMHFFDFIYTGKSVFGKDGHLKTILKKTGLNPHQVIYIGDEVRDMEAVQKAGIMGVAVTWGYNSLNMLKQIKSNYLCEEPDELARFIHTLLVRFFGLVAP